MHFESPSLWPINISRIEQGAQELESALCEMAVAKKSLRYIFSVGSTDREMMQCDGARAGFDIQWKSDAKSTRVHVTRIRRCRKLRGIQLANSHMTVSCAIKRTIYE